MSTQTAQLLEAFEGLPEEEKRLLTVEFLRRAAPSEQGLEEWTRGLLEEDAEALVDSKAGKPVRWVPGKGWMESRK